MIEKLRNEVLSIIEQNKGNEVTCHSNVEKAGIYMLYVDCFDDERIIPFYIGQTSNFQKRHRQHFLEVMALNRLHRDCYVYALFADLYNGHARPCKIFSYMVNHTCTLNDLHMIVIEEIEKEEERIKREEEYIDRLYAPFFGFNQMNSVLRYIECNWGKGSQWTYTQAEEEDVASILRFQEYGYNSYNWYRVCGAFNEVIIKKGLNQKLSKGYVQIFKSEKRLSDVKLRLAKIRRYIRWQARDEVCDICKETIDSFFTKNKLRSEEKKKLVVEVLLFERDGDCEALKRYFEKYAERICENLLDIIEQAHGKEVQQIKERVQRYQKEYCDLEHEEEKLNGIVLGDLLPKQYSSHPLGALPTIIELKPKDDDDNVCYINVEYTCFKTDYNYDLYPQICRIDYLVVKNGKSQSRTIYIENALTDFFSYDDVFYCESGFRYGPFKPYLRGRIGTHIPVSMEYKNGINERTIQNVQAENFEKVFREINRLIDDKTRVVYTTSGYKSTILRFTETARLKTLLLAKKLKRLCK